MPAQLHRGSVGGAIIFTLVLLAIAVFEMGFIHDMLQ